MPGQGSVISRSRTVPLRCSLFKKYEKEIEDLNKQVFDWQQKYALALNTAAHHENLMKHYKQEYENFAKYRSQAMIEKIIPALNRIAKNNDDDNSNSDKKPNGNNGFFFGDDGNGKNKISDITYENTSSGIKLTIQNLQFKPNSSELLPGEEYRLNQIAEALKQSPNSMFLVEGHTASTGNISGEKKLSVERAYSIAKELIKRGIGADKFIYKGSGSSKPIASNDTPEGMAKNRRVEITILE